MHQETTDSAGVPREMSVARWLFNPFVRIGGEQALVIGLGVIVASGLAAAAGGVHFDGLLDFHPGYSVSFWVPVVEGLVNWSVISVLLALVALLVAPRNVRLVDIAGTQALARFPLLLAALACVPPWVRRANEEMAAALAEGRIAMPTSAGIVAGLFGSVCVIWMVWLMWKAFRRLLQPAGRPGGGDLRGGGHRGGGGDEARAGRVARGSGGRRRARKKLTPAGRGHWTGPGVPEPSRRLAEDGTGTDFA